MSTVRWVDVLQGSDEIASIGCIQVTLLCYPHLAHSRLPGDLGFYPIHVAARNTDCDDGMMLLHDLLQMKVDVNAQSARGSTALQMAATYEGVCVLLKAGADVNMRDDEGRTILHAFCIRNRPDLILALDYTTIYHKHKDYTGKIALDYVPVSRRRNAAWSNIVKYLKYGK